jgi:hypothetical protein
MLYPIPGQGYDYIDSNIALDNMDQAHVSFEIGGALWRTLISPAE